MIFYIQEVIAQTREREAAAMTEVSWCGRCVPVKNEKVRSFILHSQQCARELERADTLDSKLTLYDSLLMECKDALQAIKDELKGDTVSYNCFFFCISFIFYNINQSFETSLWYKQYSFSYQSHVIIIKCAFNLIGFWQAAVSKVRDTNRKYAVSSQLCHFYPPE